MYARTRKIISKRSNWSKRKAMRFVLTNLIALHDPQNFKTAQTFKIWPDKQCLAKPDICDPFLRDSFRFTSDFENIKLTWKTRHMRSNMLQELTCSNSSFSRSYVPQSVREWSANQPCITAYQTLEQLIALAKNTILAFWHRWQCLRISIAIMPLSV